jgi:hypothetical protein
MAVDKAKILRELKSDLKSSEVLKKQQDAKIIAYRAQYNGKPYGNETEGKSAIVSRDIKKQSEWANSSLIDPFVSTSQIVKCLPITAEDAEAARQNELVLNTQFCRQFPRYNFMNKAIKVLDMEGTVVIQTGWDYEDEIVNSTVEAVSRDEYGNEIIVTEEVDETVIIKNQPTARICRNEDIYIDPTCEDDMEKCQFIIYRYESDISTLKRDGRYKNLDKVAASLGQVTYDYDYRPEDPTRFQFNDKARKKLIVHEYWGNYDMNEDGIAEPIVCAWVGDTIIRLQDNPYPDGKPPFIVVPFNAVPFQMHGEANSELIGDNQKVKTAIIRGVIDNMAQSNNGQVGIRKGALDPVNRKRWLKGENFEFNGAPGDFWQGSYNPIPSSAFDMIGLMNNEIESLTGVKSFSGGINGASLGTTATGARGAMDATSVRRMNIVRNIAENLVKPLLRKWMAYNAEFLSEEEVVRVTNEEFVPIRRDDLKGQIDIELTIATAEDNAAKSQELSFLLQTMGQSLPFDITKNIMADIMELMRMPDKAQKIREFEQPQDPMQEQMKQLELMRMQMEIEKLKADIADKYARSKENEIDAVLKQQKVQVEAAKARNLNSQADKLDLDWLAKESGADLDRDAALEELRARTRLEEKLSVEELRHKAKMDQKTLDMMKADKDRESKIKAGV